MNYKLGQSYLLPVKEVITENKRTFYKVEANGKEHNILLFDFQKDDEKPEDIACIVKELREGEPLFVQDTQPLLMRLYKENEVYPFWVKTDCSHLPNPYYEIADWHHFTFKLPAIGLDKLYLHQRIECRVKEIISGRIFFELIKREARTYSLPYLTIEDVLSEVETDVKTNMTKVSVALQDPLAAAIVADSAVYKLQEYITDYRTRKAKQDYDFQLNLCEQYKKEYFAAQQEYAQFADANRNVILQTVTSEKERLQKNLSLAEQIYSQSMGQLQVLRGKVQEAKPVFAVVEPATVPLVPASPKKMMIIIAFAFLAFIFESAWILFGKDIYHDFKNEMKKKD